MAELATPAEGFAMGVRESKRAKFTGRQKSAPFLQLPRHVITSDEWAALSGSAVKLIIDVASDYRGSNNGDLSAAWSVMRPRGWRSKDTLQRALTEALTARFLIITRHGGRHACHLFALTWLPVDDIKGKSLEVAPQRVPSNAWRQDANGAPESVPPCPGIRATSGRKPGQ